MDLSDYKTAKVVYLLASNKQIPKQVTHNQ